MMPLDVLSALGPPLAAGPWLGKAAFAGVYVLLIVWLAVMPSRLIEDEGRTSWWANARGWAIVIASVQIIAYVCWG